MSEGGGRRATVIAFAIFLTAVGSCSFTSSAHLRDVLIGVAVLSLFATLASLAARPPRASQVLSPDEQLHREERARALDTTAQAFGVLPAKAFGTLIATSQRLLFVNDGETVPSWAADNGALVGGSEGSTEGLAYEATAGRACLVVRYRSRGEEAQRFLVGEDNLGTWLELVELMAKGESPPPARATDDASPPAPAQAPAGRVAGLDPFAASVTGALLLTGLTVAERPLSAATAAAGSILILGFLLAGWLVVGGLRGLTPILGARSSAGLGIAVAVLGAGAGLSLGPRTAAFALLLVGCLVGLSLGAAARTAAARAGDHAASRLGTVASSAGLIDLLLSIALPAL